MSAVTPITEGLLRAHPLPRHRAGSKEARGDVLAVGGSLEVPGAIRLAGEAALRAGAGRLKIATCRSVAPMLGLALPEAMVIGLPETAAGGIEPAVDERLAGSVARTGALLVGPGMMEQPATRQMTMALLDGLGATPAVLDAGALEGLPDLAGTLARHAGRLVITPHAGEMARLLGSGRETVEADPMAAGRDAARQLHAVVVMKGARTHVVSPQGEAWRFEGGTIGLATSGSGDVLAGIITALLARGAPPAWAAIWGVYLHGEAGRRLAARMGDLGLLAREIAAEVPGVMQGLSA